MKELVFINLKKKSKGLTLLELIISTALLAIIIIPISMLILSSTKINIQSKEKIQIITRAQKHYEFLGSSLCSISSEGNNLNFNSISIADETYDSGKDIKTTSTRSKTFMVNDYIILDTISKINKFTVDEGGNSKNILYKIKVEVSKNGESLQILEGYKPIY